MFKVGRFHFSPYFKLFIFRKCFFLIFICKINIKGCIECNLLGGTVVGSIRSLRTKFNDNFAISYSKTKLLQIFNGLVYYH